MTLHLPGCTLRTPVMLAQLLPHPDCMLGRAPQCWIPEGAWKGCKPSTAAGMVRILCVKLLYWGDLVLLQ